MQEHPLLMEVLSHNFDTACLCVVAFQFLIFYPLPSRFAKSLARIPCQFQLNL